MPQAETSAPLAPPVLLPVAKDLTGWGGGPGARCRVVSPDDEDAVRAAVELARRPPRRWAGSGVIARGMGRSYGDAAQLAEGFVIDTTGLKDFRLDPGAGTVTAAAGVTIGELLEELIPQGWVVPVVPGTQHVSVAGAVASDIHGKNHGSAGTFGNYVEAVGLLRADGELVTLTRDEDAAALLATVGGMGLTGVITWVRLRLRPVGSALLSVDVDRTENLDETLAVLSAPGGPHRVAWVDLLGPQPGRSVVTRAEHVEETAGVADPWTGATVAARATVPAAFPGALLRPEAIRAFNELRFRTSPRRARGRIEPLGAHMFPLDALRAWPRLYGEHGLLQYQYVVPRGAEAVLEATFERLRRARVPSYLAVLKDFGPENEAPLSFPMAGWTLAMDFPRAASGLEAVLGELDGLVIEAGGRVYLSKDSRLRAEAVSAMYPRLAEWRAMRDELDPGGLWRSDLAERTGLVAARREPAPGPRSSGRAGGAGFRPAETVNGTAEAGAHERRRVLLLGGTSEIGLAILRRLAADGPIHPYLLGRDEDALRSVLEELEAQGCRGGETGLIDAAATAAHGEALAAVFERAGGFDVVVLAVGVLGAQAGLDADPDEARRVMQVDFEGSGSLMMAAMRELRSQGSGGTMIVLSSVAAERPRASNAVYGAAKAGLDALAQGLADAAVGTGPHVLVVRPGFVKTRMTEGLEPVPFATTAEAVAEATVKAMARGAHTVWVPGTLRFVFGVLRHLPRPLYRRLPL